MCIKKYFVPDWSKIYHRLLRRTLVLQEYDWAFIAAKIEILTNKRHPEFNSGSLTFYVLCFARRCWNKFSMTVSHSCAARICLSFYRSEASKYFFSFSIRYIPKALMLQLAFPPTANVILILTPALCTAIIYRFISGNRWRGYQRNHVTDTNGSRKNS